MPSRRDILSADPGRRRDGGAFARPRMAGAKVSAIDAISFAASTNCPAMNTDSAVPPERFPVVWKDSPGVSEKQLRLRQLVEDRAVPGLLGIGRDTEDEPKRIVVESRADVIIPGSASSETGW